ncbi:ABC transporter substrate-binding protein [Saccharothrix longispora]|uniref:Multiple sugar transport system substrate-binding protein n=1 Tax=Saccharothrix longispora TaxID=33920 RepID=A0ABU1PTC7_9PSEU|nr:extracellular solute-binding protein [Saccharothrix longispora]MDR6593897.1 multiple sugar transport system substrate-binding protein [Saccharothrix longispora]
MGRVSRRGPAGLLVSLVSLAAVLSGCGGGDSGDGPVTLRFVWWGNEDRAKVTEAAVDAFRAKNPGIEVETEYSGYDAYFQKLSTQVAGGAGPDLLQLDRATIGEYAGRNVLADLGPYLGGALKVDKIPANLLEGGKVDGRQHAVAAGATTQMLIYVPSQFRAAGVTAPSAPGETWTWAQFTEAMNRIGAAGAVAGTTDFGWAIDWFEVWLHQHDKSLYTPDGELGFTADDLAEYWELIGTMRAGRGVSAAEVTTKMDGSVQNSGIVTGQTASEVGYDSSVTGYFGAFGPDLALAPLPSDAEESGMAALPPVSFGVAQRSKNKDAAVKLLDFLLNDPEAGELLGASRGVPPNEEVRARVCAGATGGSKAVCDYEVAQQDRIGPAFGAWPTGSSAVKRDFQRTYDDVIFDRVSVADAAKRVVQDAEQSLGS